MKTYPVTVKKNKIGNREFLYTVFLNNYIVAKNITDGELAFSIQRVVKNTLLISKRLDKLK